MTSAIRQTHGPSADAGIGQDIRGLRKSKGVRLAELALAIGRSVGFVSQLERGLSQPSIADLRAIARVLDVPVGWFFANEPQDETERGFIVRAGARRALGTEEDGIVEELLSPDLGGSFELFRSVFQPGAELTEPVFRETEEAGIVISGALEFWIGERHFHLHEGDSFRFEHQPYRWRNSGTVPAIVIWAVSPPVY